MTLPTDTFCQFGGTRRAALVLFVAMPLVLIIGWLIDKEIISWTS